MNKFIGFYITCIFMFHVGYAQETSENTIEIAEEVKVELSWIPTYKEALKKSKKEKKTCFNLFYRFRLVWTL